MSSTEKFGEEDSGEFLDTTSSDSSLLQSNRNRPTRDYSRKLYKKKSRRYPKFTVPKKHKALSKSTEDEPYCCSIYITSYNILENGMNVTFNTTPFIEVLSNITIGKTKIQRTRCGIIVAFTKEQDANKVISLSLQNIFRCTVQATKLLNNFSKSSHAVIIKNVPLCISHVEIHQALKMQKIKSCKVTRINNHIKVESLNWMDMQRLLAEGLNFFNHASFQVVSEGSINQDEPDVVQCYKCQGFWHTAINCKQILRCVRCGENHDVAYCPRPRSAAVCCHCGGPHHAAYKLCPVWLQHAGSLNVQLQLSKTKLPSVSHYSIL